MWIVLEWSLCKQRSIDYVHTYTHIHTCNTYICIINVKDSKEMIVAFSKYIQVYTERKNHIVIHTEDIISLKKIIYTVNHKSSAILSQITYFAYVKIAIVIVTTVITINNNDTFSRFQYNTAFCAHVIYYII